MAKRIGFLGCGKIGRALVKRVLEHENAEVAFVEDARFVNDLGLSCPVLSGPEPEAYAGADLVVECATASALKEHLELILTHGDLLMFSVTAFSDPEFEAKARELCRRLHRHIYLPHGAILGLDGIFDGRKVWTEVSIETVKSPKSLGREDSERTVVYEGPTRAACGLYPRNVNVHAAVALAGIGFDRTHSRIVSDPAVSTNAHTIRLKGEGMDITMDISSYAAGAVTGAYTPHSACGSLDRILDGPDGLRFV